MKLLTCHIEEAQRVFRKNLGYPQPREILKLENLVDFFSLL